jgi:hypothetical protein
MKRCEYNQEIISATLHFPLKIRIGPIQENIALYQSQKRPLAYRTIP